MKTKGKEPSSPFQFQTVILRNESENNSKMSARKKLL